MIQSFVICYGHVLGDCFSDCNLAQLDKGIRPGLSSTRYENGIRNAAYPDCFYPKCMIETPTAVQVWAKMDPGSYPIAPRR